VGEMEPFLGTVMERSQVPADYFRVGFVAQHVNECRINLEDCPLHVAAADPVRRVSDQRAEVGFRSLVTNSPYGICRSDMQGTVLEVNPAFIHMLGYESDAEIVGRHLGALHHSSQEWFHLADYFADRKDFTALVSDFLRKDGSGTVLRLSGRAIRDEQDTTSFELFAEDVTEHRAPD